MSQTQTEGRFSIVKPVDDEGYTTIEIGPSSARAHIRVKTLPNDNEVNLLFVLLEARGELISWDDICYRLKITVNGVRVRATRIRKKLAPEWVIDVNNNEGLRIIKAAPLFE